MKFRADLNGLRAIAVIAVVLFHFNKSWLTGGFVGVDIFFVISGFLMTGIIFNGIENNSFSLSKFYLSRINRIIPALLTLCLTLLILGWFYLPPTDYKTLGKTVSKALEFYSNNYFSRDIGYFDTNAHTKWLLHTWSLSVEFQFYIIYPLILLALKKWLPIEKLKTTIIAITTISFVYFIYYNTHNPDKAYFSLFARIWEMTLGGLAFLYPIHFKAKNKLRFELIGVALIISAFFLLPSHITAAYLTITGVIGAYLIIQSNNNSIITNNYIFQKIGLWSYSIYLWHWPIVVASVYFRWPNWWIYAAIPATLFVGCLSYNSIEKIKFNNHKSRWIDLLKAKPLIGSILVGLLGYTVYSTNGMEKFHSTSVQIATNEALNKNPFHCMASENSTNFKPCYIGNKKNIVAIIIGDSHADALTTSITENYNLNTDGIVALTKASCPLVIKANFTVGDNTCHSENKSRMEFIKKYPDIPIFVIARTSSYFWGQVNPSRIIGDNPAVIYYNNKNDSRNEKFNSYIKDLDHTIGVLTKHNPVFITDPIPEMTTNIPSEISKRIILSNSYDDLYLSKNEYDKRNNPVIKAIEAIAKENNATVLDPTPYLCLDGKCISNIDGRPIYYDDDHMSEFGNKLLSPMFNSATVKFKQRVNTKEKYIDSTKSIAE